MKERKEEGRKGAKKKIGGYGIQGGIKRAVTPLKYLTDHNFRNIYRILTILAPIESSRRDESIGAKFVKIG